MRVRVRSRLTYANMVATLALFAALGGSAYAAIEPPANSVGTMQIKNKAVTPPKLSNRTIALFKGQKGAKGDPGPQGFRASRTTRDRSVRAMLTSAIPPAPSRRCPFPRVIT
jgi:hypothetical protein